jgi:hypothetical protein
MSKYSCGKEYPDMKDENLEDEVRFWRHLIEWWETSKSEPAPPRMYQALELAKSKAGHVQSSYELAIRH